MPERTTSEHALDEKEELMQTLRTYVADLEVWLGSDDLRPHIGSIGQSGCPVRYGKLEVSLWVWGRGNGSHYIISLVRRRVTDKHTQVAAVAAAAAAAAAASTSPSSPVPNRSIVHKRLRWEAEPQQQAPWRKHPLSSTEVPVSSRLDMQA
ncbi:hypothetical protein KC315_g10983, partial [Hortaea werneckii]